MAIKIIITDDHPVVVEGLTKVLSDYPQIQVIASFNNGADLLQGLTKWQPDVLLLDVFLPDMKGPELAGIISKAYPSIRILAVTSVDAILYVKGMMRNGCKGYLLKNASQTTLLLAIETVFKGEEFIEPSLKEQLLQNMLKYKKADLVNAPTLTRREKEILVLIVKEHTNQEIADKLFLSSRTVENHRFNLIQKLGTKNSLGLVNAAIDLGLLD